MVGLASIVRTIQTDHPLTSFFHSRRFMPISRTMKPAHQFPPKSADSEVLGRAWHQRHVQGSGLAEPGA